MSGNLGTIQGILLVAVHHFNPGDGQKRCFWEADLEGMGGDVVEYRENLYVRTSVHMLVCLFVHPPSHGSSEAG